MASMHAASAPVRAVRTPAGDPAWLVSGYDEVRALIADSRLSWTTSAAGASRYSQAAMMGHPDAPGQNSGAGMSFAKVLARSFAPRRIQQLRPRVQLCDDLLDELAAQTPPVDFHEAVSFPLPAMAICEVLGVPPQDRTEFRIWSDEAACTTDRDRAQAGRDQLHTYMAALIEDKRAHPGQDVLTDLVAAADAQGHDPQKVVVRLAAGLPFAGHETTVGAKIGLTVDSLQIQSIDDQDVGYIQAMAAPHNAAIRREAQIAQAPANQARQTSIVQVQYKAEVDKAQAEAGQAGPLAHAQAQRDVIAAQTELAQRQAELRQQELVSEVVKPADAEAERVRILARAEAERTTIQAEVAASHNRVALDQQLIDQLPQIVQQAARGLSGANVTVLNGTNGLGDLAAGLVSQGLRIFHSVRQNLGNDAPGTAPAVRQDGDR
jgi:hypothetical protein